MGHEPCFGPLFQGLRWTGPVRPCEDLAQPSPRGVWSRSGKFEKKRSAVALRLDWEGGGPRRTVATHRSVCGGWGMVRLRGGGWLDATSPGACARGSEGGVSLQCKNFYSFKACIWTFLRLKSRCFSLVRLMTPRDWAPCRCKIINWVYVFLR